MKDNKLLYICYCIPQRNYLKSNGIRYEVGGKSFNTNCPFWVYIKNEKLDKLLNEWTLGSKS